MENNDEIISILQEIQRDMRSLMSKKLKPENPIEDPAITEVSIEAKPLDGDMESKVMDAMKMDEGEMEVEEEEEEVLPRWKQRMKKGI